GARTEDGGRGRYAAGGARIASPGCGGARAGSSSLPTTGATHPVAGERSGGPSGSVKPLSEMMSPTMTSRSASSKTPETQVGSAGLAYASGVRSARHPSRVRASAARNFIPVPVPSLGVPVNFYPVRFVSEEFHHRALAARHAFLEDGGAVVKRAVLPYA